MSYAFFDTFNSLKTELNITIEENNRAVILFVTFGFSNNQDTYYPF